MAWNDVITPGVSVRPSPAESGVLAREVAHVWVGQGTPDSRDVLRDAVRVDGPFDLVITRYPSALTWVPPVIADSGRRITVAGHLVYWGTTLDPLSAAPVIPDSVVVARGEDTAACTAAIGEIFSGYVNHYSANGALPKVDVGAAYADWAARCIGGPACEVLMSRDRSGALAGIALTREADGTIEVLLAGVRPLARGRGAYAHLFAGLLQRYAHRGARELVISTQDHNIAVQRLWIKAGLTPREGVMITHLM